MTIKKIDNKEDYLDLLLLADPSKELVLDYIKESDMYGVVVDNKVVCEVVVCKVDSDSCELKNISTLDEYRGNGYASKLIKYIFDIYKGKYKTMIVGTSENMIPFYVLNGFNKYHHTVKNFFIDNYKEEIWDGNMQCIDMYYYSKEL